MKFLSAYTVHVDRDVISLIGVWPVNVALFGAVEKCG